MTNRVKKLNELIKRELGNIFLKEIEFPQNILVTLTRVKISSDLATAKIFISVIPEERSSEVLKILNSKIYSLQKKLDKRLKIKIVPKIQFLEEKSVKEAAKIEKILEKIKKIEKK